MKEMVGVLVEKNGDIRSIELNAIGGWFVCIDYHRKKYFQCRKTEDCGDFIFRTYRRETLKNFKKYTERK